MNRAGWLLRSLSCGGRTAGVCQAGDLTSAGHVIPDGLSSDSVSGRVETSKSPFGDVGLTLGDSTSGPWPCF